MYCTIREHVKNEQPLLKKIGINHFSAPETATFVYIQRNPNLDRGRTTINISLI